MDIKEILAKNVSSLMRVKYGEENFYRTMKETAKTKHPISLGSLQRIKEQKTAVGLDVLVKLAVFFELEVWQLLIENLDPTNPPVFLTDTQKEFISKVKLSFKDLVK